MMIVTGFDAARLAEEVSPEGGKFVHSDTVCLCHVVDDVIHMVVVLNRFNAHDVELSVISDGTYFSRKFIRDVYTYVFEHEGKSVAMMYTRKSNDRMNVIHEKLGHQFIGEVPGKFGDESGLLWIATAETAKRWL